MSKVRLLPSPGITRLHRYYEPFRHPGRPGLALASCRLISTADHRWGFPCSVCFPMYACRRHYPGRTNRGCPLIPLRQLRPSPSHCWVGFRIGRFEACLTFIHITTCILTEPLKRPFASKAPASSLPLTPLRLLPGGANQFLGRSVSC